MIKSAGHFVTSRPIRVFLALATCALLSVIFYGRYGHRLGQKVQAVGNLVFTFNGLPPDAPVFAEPDVKPGDCYTRPVTVENNGTTPAVITVRADAIADPDLFSTVLNLLITHNATAIYGDPAIKSVADFFIDSNTTFEGYPLSTLPAATTHTYDFQVCLPKETGNQWQQKQLVFDLVFGIDSDDNPEIPPECRHIVGGFKNVIYGTTEGEFLKGSIYNDLIFGMGGNDEVDSSSGDDCIVMGDGDDIIESEGGNDVILAGNGNNTIRAGSGNDIVYAGSGNDYIILGSGDDIVYSGGGDDYIDAGSGDDLVYAGAGNDTIYGGSGNDTIYGEEGDDFIDAGSDNDHVYGGEGNDTIYGGSGNDHLDGGDGEDWIDGQNGFDYCLAEVRLNCEAP